MNIEKLFCQLNCPDNSHVFDLLQSTSASVSGVSIGRISTILKGYGSATLEFGNWAFSGTVQVFIKGKMIASLSGNGKKKIEFDFCDGDNLMLLEVNGGIILFSDFQYDCVTNIIDREGLFFQKVFLFCFYFHLAFALKIISLYVILFYLQLHVTPGKDLI